MCNEQEDKNMKHIPIMLALALSISLTSYNGTNTSIDNNYINEVTEVTSNADALNPVLPGKSENES